MTSHQPDYRQPDANAQLDYGVPNIDRRLGKPTNALLLPVNNADETLVARLAMVSGINARTAGGYAGVARCSL